MRRRVVIVVECRHRGIHQLVNLCAAVGDGVGALRNAVGLRLSLHELRKCVDLTEARGEGIARVHAVCDARLGVFLQHRTASDGGMHTARGQRCARRVQRGGEILHLCGRCVGGLGGRF